MMIMEQMLKAVVNPKKSTWTGIKPLTPIHDLLRNSLINQTTLNLVHYINWFCSTYRTDTKSKILIDNKDDNDKTKSMKASRIGEPKQTVSIDVISGETKIELDR